MRGSLAEWIVDPDRPAACGPGIARRPCRIVGVSYPKAMAMTRCVINSRNSMLHLAGWPVISQTSRQCRSQA